MRVLIVQPQIRPYVAEIEEGLKPMQEIVGGSIEMVDLDDNTSLVCNEEGKIRGLDTAKNL